MIVDPVEFEKLSFKSTRQRISLILGINPKQSE